MSDNNSKSMGDLFPDLGPEAPVISGVAHDRSEALATVRGVPNEPGMAAKVFTELATAGVNVDMIVQAGASVGTAEISFTVPESTVKEVENVLIDKHDELGYKSFDINRSVGKVAVVGVGMKTHSGLAAKFFTALSDKGINVLMISTSPATRNISDSRSRLGGQFIWFERSYLLLPYSFALLSRRRSTWNVPTELCGSLWQRRSPPHCCCSPWS